MQDQEAYLKFIEACYQLYEQKMYHAAYRILLDTGLAEDAVQEAFLKLMQHKIYFEDAHSDDCKRYMISVIKHASIDIYNKKKKEQKIIYFSNDNMWLKDLSSHDDIDAGPDIGELISALPPKYYAVVNCLVMEDLSVKETAAELGITGAAVRKRFERAKRKLKTMQKGSEGYETAGKRFRSGIC